MAARKSIAKSAQRAAAQTLSSASISAIQLQLRIVAVELRDALSAITVASHALCEQSADIDPDVALVLRRGAGAPIHAALERIESLLDELADNGRGDGGTNAGRAQPVDATPTL